MSRRAVFAAGCFWGVEEKFRTFPGVIETKVGYTGGNVNSPTYIQVCGGNTGHAEAIEIRYDTKKIDYEKLIEFFFSIHNPTTMNRQGLDVGDQYRSAIFFDTDEEKQIAEDVKRRLNMEQYNGSIVTEITKAGEFFDAEEYHQKYIMKKG